VICHHSKGPESDLVYATAPLAQTENSMGRGSVSLSKQLETSLRNLCSAGYTTL